MAYGPIIYIIYVIYYISFFILPIGCELIHTAETHVVEPKAIY